MATMTDGRSYRAGTQALTAPELLALGLASYGLGTKHIAAALGKSPDTIKTQLRSCRYKLGTKNRTHSVAKAIRDGLIP